MTLEEQYKEAMQNGSGVIKVEWEKEHIVNNPSHYSGSIQPIDFIEAQGLGFNLGNVIKYCSRAGKKDPTKLIEDLKKAQYYLNREISNLEKKD